MVDKLEILDYLDEIEDSLENASVVPFTGKIMLDRQELIDIISNISSKLPEEYQHVKYLFKNREEILESAEKDADEILEKAMKIEKDTLDDIEVKKNELNRELSEEHQKMIDETQIVRDAKLKAQEIIEDAKRKARGMRASSFDYSHKMLLRVHDDISNQLDVIEKNLTELDKMK